MATGKKWDEIFKEMSDETLKDVKHHLLGLQNVVKFADEWKDTGLFTLISYIDLQMMYREEESKKKTEDTGDKADYPFKCSCSSSRQADCQWSKGNGIAGSKKPEEMSDCMNRKEICAFQVEKPKDQKQKFVVLSYNPSKGYLWTMHREGCADIAMELKGIRTDSGFPAIDPQTVEAKDWEEAAENWIDEELKEMGWTADAIRINPCCKGGK